jgi:hypothetical protein
MDPSVLRNSNRRLPYAISDSASINRRRSRGAVARRKYGTDRADGFREYSREESLNGAGAVTGFLAMRPAY